MNDTNNFENQILRDKKTLEDQLQKLNSRIQEIEGKNTILERELHFLKKETDRFGKACENERQEGLTIEQEKINNEKEMRKHYPAKWYCICFVLWPVKAMIQRQSV